MLYEILNVNVKYMYIYLDFHYLENKVLQEQIFVNQQRKWMSSVIRQLLMNISVI